MSEPDLRTTVAGLTLPNPLMVASGCAGTGRELEPFLALGELGALVTRSVTLDPRAGGAPPRVVETPSGILADVDVQSSGLQGFLATELPWLAQQQVRTVVSIAGDNLGGWAELGRRVGTSPGVSAVEVNLSWPPGSRAARDPYQAGKVVGAVRRDLPRAVPLLAKIAPDAQHVVDVAGAVTDAGAEVVVVGHGMPGLVLDPTTLRPALGSRGASGGGSGMGSLSGPAVHPVTLRCLWQVHQALPEVHLVGSGGVRSGFDALAMLAVGARAVQLGAAVLHEPAAPRRVLSELSAELDRRGLAGVADAIGLAHRPEGAAR